MKGKGRQKSSDIEELRRELAEREQDLATYRGELEAANQKLEALITRLTQELSQLTRLQHVLVPTELPHVSGFDLSSKFLPGTQKGGDYFDIFEHEDKLRFGVVLAHSSGYAASALFLSVLLKLTGQMEARRFRHADEILLQLSDELKTHFSPQDEADVFYAVVDRRTFELEYASAGRNMLMHIGHGGEKLQRLTGDGKALGFEGPKSFSRKTLTLSPKDRLIFCTSGCVQATNDKGEKFGEERLYRAVLESSRGGVHDLRNEILFRLQQFSGKHVPTMDQTVLVLEVKDRVIRLTR